MIKNYEKVIKIFFAIGIVLLCAAIPTTYNSLYIGAGAAFIIAVYYFWRYKKKDGY